MSSRPGPHGSVVTRILSTPAVVVAFAFLGGAILNLMPCVFPILSMKAVAWPFDWS